MKKLLLLLIMTVYGMSLESAMAPFLKVGVGTIFLGASYKFALQGNARKQFAEYIAAVDNPAASSLAILPKIGSVIFQSCSVASGLLGSVFMVKGMRHFVK